MRYDSPKTNFPIWRSMLFVPAHIEKFVDKAHQQGADAYILDLEDSVPLAEKAAARQMVGAGAAKVSQSGSAVVVRINHPLRLAIRDLEAVVDRAISTIVIPKVSQAEQVKAIDSIIEELETEQRMEPGHTRLIAQIESADALPHLDEIATSSPRLLGMILGSEDFSASAGMKPTPKGLFAPNQAVLFACRRAGILPLGFPASIADFSDLEKFRAAIKEAQSLGFVGAFCIHPNQVAILNEAFTPSATELSHAQRLINAFEKGISEGRGAVEFEGKMIDAPVVTRARELLSMASR